MSILALTSNTLVTAASGQIEYNGQFFGTDSNASRAQLQRITAATAVASTSGTSIDFTGIPAWVKRITVLFQGVSTSGTSNYLCQIGSGSVTTSGYTAFVNLNTNLLSSSSGFIQTFSISAAAALSGCVVLTLITGNTWVSNGQNGRSNDAAMQLNTGSIALGGALDRVRITTVNGTDTFDLGTINIIYEG